MRNQKTGTLQRRSFLARSAQWTAGAWFTSSLWLTVARTAGANEARGTAPRWPVEWSVDHFHFHADYDPRPQLGDGRRLHNLRAELTETLGIKIDSEVVHLILFAQADAYFQYLKLYFPSVPQRRALFIKRRGPGMVFAHHTDQLEVDLRHETTHALLNSSLPYVPLWLDEGLAEYFETDANQRVRNGEHLAKVRWGARLLNVPDVKALEDIEDLAHMRPSHYRHAWSWVHFLLHESVQSRAVLQRFLQDIQSGLPPGPLSRRIAAEIPNSKDRYLSHFRSF